MKKIFKELAVVGLATIVAGCSQNEQTSQEPQIVQPQEIVEAVTLKEPTVEESINNEKPLEETVEEIVPEQPSRWDLIDGDACGWSDFVWLAEMRYGKKLIENSLYGRLLSKPNFNILLKADIEQARYMEDLPSEIMAIMPRIQEIKFSRDGKLAETYTLETHPQFFQKNSTVFETVFQDTENLTEFVRKYSIEITTTTGETVKGEIFEMADFSYPLKFKNYFPRSYPIFDPSNNEVSISITDPGGRNPGIESVQTFKVSNGVEELLTEFDGKEETKFYEFYKLDLSAEETFRIRVIATDNDGNKISGITNKIVSGIDYAPRANANVSGSYVGILGRDSGANPGIKRIEAKIYLENNEIPMEWVEEFDKPYLAENLLIPFEGLPLGKLTVYGTVFDVGGQSAQSEETVVYNLPQDSNIQ